MKVLVRFAEGIDRIQNVPEWAERTRVFETLKPGVLEYCKVEFKGHLLGRIPVYEEKEEQNGSVDRDIKEQG